MHWSLIFIALSAWDSATKDVIHIADFHTFEYCTVMAKKMNEDNTNSGGKYYCIPNQTLTEQEK